MRLWSLHPKYLDATGLVALWREALLAKKVLEGSTRAYAAHPQLIRFRKTKNPSSAINAYLSKIYDEARARNYNFNPSKISYHSFVDKIPVTDGQIEYERRHLAEKLGVRSPQMLIGINAAEGILPHPIFKIVPGDVENWERI